MIELIGVGKCFKPYRESGSAISGQLHGIPQDSYILRDMTLAIDPGERIGLIGPNGAGKSTTIKILLGLIKPTIGEVRVFGLDPSIAANRRQIVKRMGVVFGQRTKMIWDIAVIHSFYYYGYLYGMSQDKIKTKLDEIAENFRINDLLEKPVRSLSLGQRMISELAVTLIHTPDLLILDEPTLGLDFEVKSRYFDALREYVNSNNATLIITSHDLSDVEKIANRMVIVNKGRLVFDDSVDILRHTYDNKRVITATLSSTCSNLSIGISGIDISLIEPSKVLVSFPTAKYRNAEVIRAIIDNLPISELNIQESPIEDVIRCIYRASENG